MVSIARVNIWNTFVGAVAWDDSRGYATFEYDPGFLKKGWDISPLTMSMEDASTGNNTELTTSVYLNITNATSGALYYEQNRTSVFIDDGVYPIQPI